MILLIGCGNVLRRDDGAGQALARRVARRSRRSDLHLLLCHQLSPELALRLADPDTSVAIFADAAVSPLKGPLLIPLPQEEEKSSSLGHHLTPLGVLTLAEKVFGRSPPAWLARLPGEDFGYGRGFSSLASLALTSAEKDVLDLLGRLRAP